jgi:hypothetical protein
MEDDENLRMAQKERWAGLTSTHSFRPLHVHTTRLGLQLNRRRLIRGIFLKVLWRGQGGKQGKSGGRRPRRSSLVARRSARRDAGFGAWERRAGGVVRQKRGFLPPQERDGVRQGKGNPYLSADFTDFRRLGGLNRRRPIVVFFHLRPSASSADEHPPFFRQNRDPGI